MAREMLKLRKGDSAIMIKTDGSIEMAGVQDKELVDDKGRMSPCILFAAAWARRDEAVMNVLVLNFKQAVREGLFGEDAKNDFAKMEEETTKLKDDSKVGASDAINILNEKGMTNKSKKEEINAVLKSMSKTASSGAVTGELSNVRPAPQTVNIGGEDVEVTMTPEEKSKKDREDARLQAISDKGQDPKVKKQMEAMMSGATKVETKPYTRHMEEDLPVEQTMKFKNASPAEQAEMKSKEKQVIGNATIEEK